MMVIPNRVRVVAVMLALALAGGLLTLALLAKPTHAQGQGATSEQFPIAFTHDATDCAGEIIDVTGTMHVTNHFMPQEDGTYHINSHLRLRAEGVGQTTGEEYVIHTKTQAFENYVQPGQLVVRTIDTTLVIGKGSIPNPRLFIASHFIVNPDGTLKMESSNFHFQCQQ